MVLHADRGPDVAGAVITMVSCELLFQCIVAYITFALRVYTRLRYAPWGLEDWFMTAALPFFTVLSIACIACGFTGIGATNATLSLPENQGYQETGLFWFFLFEVFYCVNIIPVKLSIGLTLVRIAENRRVYAYVQYGVMAMCTIMNLIAGFYIIFHCNPVAAAWDTSLLEKGGKCNPAQILADIYYATTAVNIFTDWVTAFMPIPLLWNVQLNRNTKVSVAVILGLGFFASLSACVRLKYTVNLTASDNYLYALADIVIWGYAENGMGVIVGCVMTLRPLFRRTLRLGGTGEGSSSHTNNKQRSTTMGSSARRGFGSNARRTYQECDADFELGMPGGRSRGGREDTSSGDESSSDHGLKGPGKGMTLTQVLGGGGGGGGLKRNNKEEDDGGRASSFETESQTEILKTGRTDEEPSSQGAHVQFPHGIMVTKHVNLTRSGT